MADETKSNLTTVIEQINKHEILIPDFQRKFVWKDEEQQKKLVVSVLCKMPIGSILLLQANPNDYAAKVIGCAKKKVNTSIIQDDVFFLLDGQQRITVLANVFSNVIHENCPKVSELISTALKKRFFLVIPKWRYDLTDDLFGIRKLQFPYESRDLPEYLTAQIYDYIYVENFTASDNKPYNPAQRISEELDSFCINQEQGYFVPLFFMCPFGKHSNIMKTRLRTTVNLIASRIEDAIINYWELLVDCEDKKKFVHEIFGEEADNISDESTMKDILADRREAWSEGLRLYLNSCIDNILMGQIKVDASQRTRAIDIYENLNRGGVCLNTFDLVMARVAKVSQRNFHERVIEAMEAPKDYYVDVLPDNIKNIISNSISNREYNATTTMKCLSDDGINSKFIDIFLDVLSICSYVPDLDYSQIKLDHIKKNNILALLLEQINDNCEKVIKALDRAMFFLQTRCGVRTIKEVNYALILLVIATIFLEDQNFRDKKVHDLLEAWYWSVLFSGEYDKDQNVRAIDNLKNIFRTLNTKDITWLNTIRESVFNCKNFSDRDLLLMDKVNDGRIPKQNMGKFICQFVLSKVYPDMFNAKKMISVFCEESDKLQIHHIIPLASARKIGESSKKLRKQLEHICNSPLNLVYITDVANNMISSYSLEDYVKELTDGARSALHISAYTNAGDRNSEKYIHEILAGRFTAVKGDVENRINECLLGWQ